MGLVLLIIIALVLGAWEIYETGKDHGWDDCKNYYFDSEDATETLTNG